MSAIQLVHNTQLCVFNKHMNLGDDLQVLWKLQATDWSILHENKHVNLGDDLQVLWKLQATDWSITHEHIKGSKG